MAKDASQYKVTFPYGATSPPYGTAALPYHRGDDRAMPVGTPVLVNGVQIGLSGSSGLSTGPHLHIGRWVGGKDTNPHGLGFTVTGATVTQVSSDNENGNFVRIADADGSSWVYLHLSEQDVKVGQKLQGGAQPMSKDALTREEIAGIYQLAFDNNDYPESLISAYTGKPLDGLITQLLSDPSWKSHKDKVNNPPTSGVNHDTVLKYVQDNLN